MVIYWFEYWRESISPRIEVGSRLILGWVGVLLIRLPGRLFKVANCFFCLKAATLFPMSVFPSNGVVEEKGWGTAQYNKYLAGLTLCNSEDSMVFSWSSLNFNWVLNWNSWFLMFVTYSSLYINSFRSSITDLQATVVISLTRGKSALTFPYSSLKPIVGGTEPRWWAYYW